MNSPVSRASQASKFAWVLNLSDHLVNRVIDAGIGVLLLVFLSVEDFSSLALAQAVIAPTLLLFVAPESILYRDFLGLSHERFSAIRKFAWLKIAVAIALGFGLSLVSGLKLEYFLWGYCLAVGPQLLGPLKEYLRLSLKLKELQISNILYKFLLLIGVCVFLGVFKASFEWIVIWAWSCTLCSWSFLRYQCGKVRDDLSRTSSPFANLGRDWREITSVLREFSGWAHVQGVFQGWVQTLDLLTLGWVGAPSRLVGLYAAALKIANFSLVVCVSLGNLFSVKLARTEVGNSGVIKNEKDELGVKSFTFFGIGMGIAAVGTLLAPWVFRALSRGKYTEADIETLSRLLGIFLISYAVLGATVIHSTWLTLMCHVQQSVKWIYIPWFLVSFVIYFGASLSAVSTGLLDPVAWANLPVAAVLYFALWTYTRRRASFQMSISVVIPPWGRCREVIDTVKGLLAQTRMPDEIIVVDQNVPPFSELDLTLSAFPEVKHIHHEVKGVLLNMELGVKAALFDIILFVDDDIVPDPKLVEEHLSVYKADTSKKIGGVAGRVDQPNGDLAQEDIRQVGHVSKWSGSVIANFNCTSSRTVDFGPGGNMSFRKSVLIDAGLMDHGFIGNAYFFEPDLGMRVNKLGYQIRFEPKAYVKHLMAPAGGVRIHDKSLHHYYFVRNGVRLFKKHGFGVFLPFVLARYLVISLLKAVKNLNPKIALKGVKGLLDGIRS